MSFRIIVLEKINVNKGARVVNNLSLSISLSVLFLNYFPFLTLIVSCFDQYVRILLDIETNYYSFYSYDLNADVSVVLND